MFRVFFLCYLIVRVRNKVTKLYYFLLAGVTWYSTIKGTSFVLLVYIFYLKVHSINLPNWILRITDVDVPFDGTPYAPSEMKDAQ